jgi:hypothetical protein
MSDSTLTIDSVSKLYILDETWTPDNAMRFSTDDSPNYIQMEGAHAVVCSRSRKSSLFIEGEIDGLEINEETEVKKTTFFVRGRERSIGKLVSVEIIENSSGEIIIHVFQKLGKYDTYFSAHSSSDIEKDQIVEYWQSH